MSGTEAIKTGDKVIDDKGNVYVVFEVGKDGTSLKLKAKGAVSSSSVHEITRVQK